MDSFLKKYCSSEWQAFVDFHKETLEFKANEIILKEGDPVNGFLIINEGKAKVYSTNSEGKEMIIRLAADGYIIGHRGFGGDWTYPVSAKAYEKTVITYIPLAIFNQVAKANAEFTYQLMMFFAEELRQSEEKNNLIPVKNRVAKAILINYSVFGSDPKDSLKLSYTISRKDFASKANTTYETVIRVLGELNKENIIQLQSKFIRIIDLQRLRDISESV
ncbi:MAG: transcriptional regulator [Flavobacteriales bacterium CG18_big_fil_WC_8_21_14_2_50_32_9]|nr:MAG: transcriptional regulator [Flavobacteriales bacterium CG18_big_fil_WC_8_21_14_2_50_32_9]